MSNTRSSRLSSRGSTQHLDVREMVSERVGREWCLFLDRDGVINRQVVGDYVRSRGDFVWLPGARLALAKLREWAPHLVIVTNQQGVGKGLMSADDLAAIHQQIQAELATDGVAIDAFQVCPHLESALCACRKPRPGLIVDWLGQNPEAEPSLSIMVGDSHSDLELAHNVAAITGGCASIQIGGRASVGGVADASFDSLWDFAVAVGHARGEQAS
jgi:histidinol-phosphate phosphatase family protein